MKLLHGFGATVTASLCLISAAHAGPARIVTLPAFTSAYVSARSVEVYLPEGYDNDHQPYAVLYMQDGRNLWNPATAMGGQTWGADAALSRLMAKGLVRQTIIVGIDNTPARSREYMPQKVFDALPAPDRETLAKAMGGAPLSDAYLKYLVTELKPRIDQSFRTRPDRDNTFIMGSSMGGLISLYALSEYPDVFGGAGCLSTHWPLPAFTMNGPKLPKAPVMGAFAAYLEPSLPSPRTHRIWFDHGDQTLDSAYAPYQDEVDALFVKRGWLRDKDFASRAYPGAAHNEASWRIRLADPLQFLLQQPR